MYEVAPFFGSTPTFALDKPLRVQKDFRIALTVPTWAPVLATVGVARSSWWRASRPKDGCGKDEQLSPPSAQQKVREIGIYACTYFNSRLLYTATYVPDPKPTTPKTGTQSKKASARAAIQAYRSGRGRTGAAVLGGASAP